MLSNEIALDLKNISKRYEFYQSPKHRLAQLFRWKKKAVHEEFCALKNINLQIKSGESVGVMGVNGSGKSTLLQIICGVLCQTEGEILVNGKISALLELGSGFNMEFTGRENVYLSGAIRGMSKIEIDQSYGEIIGFAEIGDFINQPVKTYSSGMLMRLAFSVAIHVKPNILIIDEALSVGDELFQKKCFSKIERLKEGGATILFVSHSGQQVVDLCDRAILLDRGECLISGAPKDVYSSYQKLIYSPFASREEVRKLIKERQIHESNNSSLVEFNAPDEFYGPGFEALNNNNIVSYEVNGAKISNLKICTLDKEKVNHLIRGRQYLFSYSVCLHKEISQIKFATLIKNIAGVEIGGALWPYSSNNAMVSASNLRVEFRFECNLNPGVYFFNAGVRGLNESGADVYMHRIVDGLAFKVLPVENNISTALVDFKFNPKVSINESLV
jgi:lipopolysaccharide transport system ATP-binding protein